MPSGDVKEVAAGKLAIDEPAEGMRDVDSLEACGAVELFSILPQTVLSVNLKGLGAIFEVVDCRPVDEGSLT